MENARKRKLMLRSSLATAGAIALFWTIYYLVAGQVPIVTGLKMTPEWTLQLPFGMSRWWDVLIGPIWSIIFISVLTSKKIKKNEDLIFGLVFGLVVGLSFGLGLGLVFDPGFGLVPGLVFALVFSLISGPVFGLGLGLGFSLVFALVFSLVSGPVFGLGLGLVFGLVALIKWVCSRKFWTSIWTSIGNWLLVKNKKTEEI